MSVRDPVASKPFNPMSVGTNPAESYAAHARAASRTQTLEDAAGPAIPDQVKAEIAALPPNEQPQLPDL